MLRENIIDLNNFSDSLFFVVKLIVKYYSKFKLNCDHAVFPIDAVDIGLEFGTEC